MLQRNDRRIPGLLQSSLQVRFGAGTPSLPSSDAWIKLLWEFLASTEPWSHDLKAFSSISLLPVSQIQPGGHCQQKRLMLLPLAGFYVCNSVLGMPPLSTALAASLRKLGVMVLDEVPDYVIRHRKVLGELIHFPSDEGVLECLERVSQDSKLRSETIATFNASATKLETQVIVKLVASAVSVHHKTVFLFEGLKLFTDLTGQAVSVEQVGHVSPGDLPPIVLPWSLLSCSELYRQAAVRLGATEVSLHFVVEAMLKLFLSNGNQYSTQEVQLFMQYFLINKTLTDDPPLLALARKVKFVPTKSGQLNLAEDVYDPSSQLLLDLFYDENDTKFPCGIFAEQHMLDNIKKVGLRAEGNVKSEDIVNTANLVAHLWLTKRQDAALRKANGLWQFLKTCGFNVNDATMKAISLVQCLPCVQGGCDRPTDYPISLPLKSDPALVRPTDMYSHKLLPYVGSVVAVLKPGMAESIAERLQVKCKLLLDTVLQHLHNVVTQHFQQQEALQYRHILLLIFKCLKPCGSNDALRQQLENEKCILVESSEQLACPRSFWIHQKPDDIVLKPYRFPLPMEMVEMEDLLVNCGSSLQQSPAMLHTVLAEIEMSHRHHTSRHPHFERDMQLTRHILDVLKRNRDACDGKTILPVLHAQTDILRFKPARDCTIMPTTSQPFAGADAEYEISYVHPGISHDTALALGALLMKDRAMTGLEGLDYSYGQHEDLTARLHNLLRDSYTDGLSVPKELIQNADDAGATEVRFLLDERQNSDARKNLFSENMAFLQGPAIWVYNNAKFSNTDFDNIIKFGAGTKKEDTSKIGKFGLGFNSVYNLTDVPSFLSRNIMAMFDPHAKYLGRPGVKVNFDQPINQDLLSRMPEQFQPFQNVFGCTLQKGIKVNYNGTLFRFPLRTDEQAPLSKIKCEGYSEAKRREFLRMLLERAGSLLMFTQSVKKVQVFHLPSHCSDPEEATCLLTVNKTSTPRVIKPETSLNDLTILKFMETYWSNKNRDIKIQENICIEVAVTKEAKVVCSVEETHSSTEWRLAWTSGTERSAELALRHKQEGLVPLAAVAVLLGQEGLKALKNTPPGFYTSCHLFCILPLPAEMTTVSLPVHVNGMFALTSSRRSLLVQTEDDTRSVEASFNSALFGDAVCRAYLLLLELVKKEAAMDSDFRRFFDLWPRTDETPLVDSFYKHLVWDGYRVLPVPGTEQWVALNEARFLQPSFRDSECGRIAFDALQKIFKGSLHLVDVPTSVCKLMQSRGPPQTFVSRVITEHIFYEHVFFPYLNSGILHPEHRDKLVLHALLEGDKELAELIRSHCCIPCKGSSLLRKPSELLHPHGRAASLFLPCEGVFPQDSERQQSQSGVNFCSGKALQHLSELGMITDDLPWDMVLERARSVECLVSEDKVKESQDRTIKLIEYLASTSVKHTVGTVFNTCPQAVKTALSETRFLPVHGKPADWPFPWYGDRLQGPYLLASPIELYSDSLKHLVACKVKLLDTKLVGGSASFLTGKKKEVLQWLGVVMEENSGNPDLVRLAAGQLIAVASLHNAETPKYRELSQTICHNIYRYLTACLTRGGNSDIRMCLLSQFSASNTADAPVVRVSQGVQHICNKEIIWTGAEFVRPSQVSFCCAYNCSPYLFQMDRSLHQYRIFFEAVGVKEQVDAADVLEALGKLNSAHAGEEMTREQIMLASRVAQLLAEIVMASGRTSALDVSRVYLPDSKGYMQPATRLCVDDCDWLLTSDSMNFAHDQIPAGTARILGVQSKKGSDFESIAEPIVEPFGQSEKLTRRIKRLLEGYTFDSSLFKELLQNADDAGATELKLIKDFRHLGTKKVPDKMHVLQGPALCVYNNRSFTKQDMLGIQNLGQGSKEQDAVKIGQFGVGFNAVYHITDVPSFWTLEDERRDVICVLDPNCRYVPNAAPSKPGTKFINIERVKTAYPDMFEGYLSKAIDMKQPGTLFRFPLRTDSMANCSDIKRESVTCDRITKVLDEFKHEMSMCLLFLNNLQKIGVYSVNPDGTLKQEYEVKMELDDNSCGQVSAFKTKLHQASRIVANQNQGLREIPSFEAVVWARLTDSCRMCEEWLIVHRVGFQDRVRLSPELQNEWHQRNVRLLPRGGVAFRMKETPEKHSSLSFHKAFCILPLPGTTPLPVHVNGHFALDHETRRNLWEKKDQQGDVWSEWNSAIALHVVVPAYITVLKLAKRIFLSESGLIDGITMVGKLAKYHSLFPGPVDTSSNLWNKLMQEVYKTIAKQELCVFPVLCIEQSTLEWAPAVRKDGFPGYFSNLRAALQVNTYHRPVVLSHGATAYPTYTSQTEKAGDVAKELQVLLTGLNMKILETPFNVYNNFKQSGVTGVQQVTPDTVLTFLSSVCQRAESGCNIDGLPKPVTETPLKSVNNTKKLLTFVSKDEHFLDRLEGLPLCLRQSERLYLFRCTDLSGVTPIASKFCLLLPGSADRFLHIDILDCFPADKIRAIVQDLSIPMFANMLPQTLTDPCYRTGSPCIFDQQRVSQVWLRRLWEFIDARLQPVKSSSSGEDIQRSERGLQSLQEWNLIPVTKRDRMREVLLLYPVKFMNRVLYLTRTPNHSNSRLWSILKTLPLPRLETSLLPTPCVLQELVAAISHPRALLYALASCPGTMTASQTDARTILDYFNNNLSSLENSYESKAELVNELKSLSLYPAVDGSLVSIDTVAVTLCLTSAVPQEGLARWSCSGRMQVLLRKALLPPDLLEYLDLQSPTDAEFYSRYLLPTLEALPRQAIVIHMKFLRNTFFANTFFRPHPSVRISPYEKERKKLCEQLRSTAFIEVEGNLHLAHEFYTPREPVFRLMCSEAFPPAPYNEDNWQELMKAAGMISEITSDMFLRFAQRVERLGQINITASTTAMSETLVKHMYEKVKLGDGRLLSLVKGIRFVLPSDWMLTSDGQQLSKITQPFCSRRLVSFSESCFEEHLYHVWSSSCILHPSANPRRLFPSSELQAVMNWLGMQETAPKEKVIRHTQQVCQALAKPNAFSCLQGCSAVLTKVMERLYVYLNDNTDDHDLQKLKQLPIVCDTEHSQMLRPDQAVIELRECETIRGYIEKAPVVFGRHFAFFKRLGVAPFVTASHYATVLTQLKAQSRDQPLHVEEMKTAVKAVAGLFRCLRGGSDEQRRIAVNALYLPTTKETLHNSRNIVFADSDLDERLTELPDDMQLNFFIGFETLKIDVKFPEEEVVRLPEKHRMAMLSDIAMEVVPDVVRGMAVEGEQSRRLAAKLSDPQLKEAIVRLTYDHCKKNGREYTDETAEYYLKKLSEIYVMQCVSVETKLTLNNTEIPGSERKMTCFAENRKDGTRNSVVFIEASAFKNAESSGDGDLFLQSLVTAVLFVLELSLDSYLVHQVLKFPAKARECLDNAKIKRCSYIIPLDTPLIPKPGTFVPLRDHCHLDNGFYEFYEGEHVGYEVHDPLADINDNEDNIAVYIYAIVLHEVCKNGTGTIPLLAKRYRIDLGPDRGEAEVSVTQLYKFSRKTQRDPSSPTAQTHRSTPVAGNENLHLDLSSVRREIRATMTEAWKVCGRQELRRVMFRLLLKWHPDKNLDNKTFCTRVTQDILRYEETLSQGRSLAEDDERYDGGGRDDVDGQFYRPGSSFSPSFFARTSARGRDHRAYHDSNMHHERRPGEPRGSQYSPRANPQPGEGRRWFRTAEDDLAAAQAARGQCDRGRNWVCFQCHQVKTLFLAEC